MRHHLIDKCLNALVEELSKNEFICNFKCDLQPKDRDIVAKWAAGKSKLELVDAISKLLSTQQAPNSLDDSKNQIEEIIDLADQKPDFPSGKRAELHQIIEYLESKSESSPAGKGTSKVLDQLKQNAEAIVMVVRVDHLKECSNNKSDYILESSTLADRRIHRNNIKICQESKFFQQRSANLLGTGFFIEDHLIATAAHILYPPFENLKLSEIRFVKGIFINKDQPYKGHITVQKSNVYKVDTSQKTDFELTSLGPDWALIPVVPENQKESSLKAIPRQQAHSTSSPRVVGYNDEVYEQQKLYALGHGLGLPLKVSLNGIVHTNDQNKDYFKCKMELVSGNSGSPIFDAQTHKVVGILVRGQPDFVATRRKQGAESIYCLSLNNYSDTYTGEECQRMSPIIQRLNSCQPNTVPMEQSVFENI